MIKTLILGGVKSGKSRFAEQQATQCFERRNTSSTCIQNSAQTSSILVIATATAWDDEMQARIDQHIAERPDGWLTIEAPIHLAQALNEAQHENNVVIIDCLTLWLTNLLMHEDATLLEQEVSAFEKALAACAGNVFIVSNETNMGIVPLGDITRKYCDQAGLLHQRIAKLCDEVKLVYPQPLAPPERFDGIEASYYFLSPMADHAVISGRDELKQSNMRLATEYCLKHPQWRLTLQMHKILGID